MTQYISVLLRHPVGDSLLRRSSKLIHEELACMIVGAKQANPEGSQKGKTAGCWDSTGRGRSSSPQVEFLLSFEEASALLLRSFQLMK